MKLLEPQAITPLEKLKNVLLALVLNFIWIELVFQFLEFAFDQPRPISPPYQLTKLWLIFAVILTPLYEELKYRVIPIILAKSIGESLNISKEKFLLPIIGLSSIIFGLNHGYGLVSLLIQGVGGFIISILYIKNNYSYWSVVLFHAIWNLTHPQ